MQRYITVAHESESEAVINRSRFISKCFPVSDEGEATEKLALVRAKYADASHTCYAYRTGERAEASRYSDAGEPSGTAGMPILTVLSSNGLTNALVTVTRYFGGILLGKGGLARAYGGGAAEAVALAGKVERLPGEAFTLEIDYPRYGALEGYIRENARIDGTEFAERVRILASVPADGAEAFRAGIIELSDGRVKPVPAGQVIMERKI